MFRESYPIGGTDGEPEPRKANYLVEENTSERIVLRDIGPWDRYMTITNAAESVVASLDDIGSRRVFYYDSEGEWGELIIKNGRFAGFGPGL